MQLAISVVVVLMVKMLAQCMRDLGLEYQSLHFSGSYLNFNGATNVKLHCCNIMLLYSEGNQI